jgi:lysophospholipase L1-like esterase
MPLFPMKSPALPFALLTLVLGMPARALELAPAAAPASIPTAEVQPALVASPGQAPATTIPDDRNYRPRAAYRTQMEDYMFTMKGKPVDLVFIGDSITEQWRWGWGKPVWDKYYADRAIDFGLGSDTTQNALWRLKNLPLDGFAPKAAVVLIGTNNFKDTPDDIAAGVQAVVAATQAKFAGIKVILVSILPNARATATMVAANALIAKFADQQSVFYLDVAAKFTPEGDNWKGLDRWKLHLTTEGYEIWAAELNELLPRVLPAR